MYDDCVNSQHKIPLGEREKFFSSHIEYQWYDRVGETTGRKKGVQAQWRKKDYKQFVSKKSWCRNAWKDIYEEEQERKIQINTKKNMKKEYRRMYD